MSLTKKTISGIRWQTVAQIFSQVVHSTITIILARLLVPGDFGIVSMATIFVGFVDILNNWGMAQGIIQKKKISQLQLSSLFWFNLLVGFAIFGLMVLVSPYIADFYHKPIIRPIVILVSLTYIIGSFGSIHRTRLTRRLDFRRGIIPDMIGVVVRLIVSVSMALMGFAFWSLVGGILAKSLSSNIALWVIYRWKPKWRLRFSEVKSIFSFSLNYMGSGIMNFVAGNIDYLMIGRFIGAANLGIYTMAYNLARFPAGQVSGIVSGVAFPAFSKVQDDHDRLHRGYLKAARNMTMIVFPLIFGLIAVAPEFVKVIYSDKWIPAILPLQILGISGIATALGSIYLSVFWSKGRADLAFKINISKVILMVGGVLYAVRFGVIGVAVAMSFFITLYCLIFLFLTHHLIKMKFSKYWRAVSWPMVSALVMMSAIFGLRYFNVHGFKLGDVEFLILEVVFGIIIYSGVLYLFSKETLTDFIDITKMFLRRR